MQHFLSVIFADFKCACADFSAASGRFSKWRHQLRVTVVFSPHENMLRLEDDEEAHLLRRSSRYSTRSNRSSRSRASLISVISDYDENEQVQIEQAVNELHDQPIKLYKRRWWVWILFCMWGLLVSLSFFDTKFYGTC